MSNKSCGTEVSDVQFCWEQVLRVRPQFRISHLYAPKEISTGLLAMHALLASFEEAVSSASDEAVSHAKLTWWQQELLGRDFAMSQHPIVKVLHRSIETPSRIQSFLQQVLELSLERVESPAPADEAALLLLCGQLGCYPMRLEFALEPGGDVTDDCLSQSCVATGLLQLLRESARSEYRAYWWLPLNLLARCGISRSEFIGRPPQDTAAHLMELVYAGVLGAGPNAAGMEDFEVRMKGSVNPHTERHRHWSVQSVLQARLLSRLKNIHPERYANELSKTRLADAWCAWQAARQWTEREGTA